MHGTRTNGAGAQPWGCVHSLDDFAARLGRSSQTARRIIDRDAALRAAARCFAGTVWLPAAALAEWWERQPRLSEWTPRVVPVRAGRGRFFDSGGVMAARTDGEARRKAELKQEASA